MNRLFVALSILILMCDARALRIRSNTHAKNHLISPHNDQYKHNNSNKNFLQMSGDMWNIPVYFLNNGHSTILRTSLVHYTPNSYTNNANATYYVHPGEKVLMLHVDSASGAEDRWGAQASYNNLPYTFQQERCNMYSNKDTSVIIRLNDNGGKITFTIIMNSGNCEVTPYIA